MNYKVSAANDAVIIVDIEYDKDLNQSFLLSSDHHWDNPLCTRKLLKKHHDQALERGAGIFCFGDMLCIMQGKYDKRSSKTSLRPEHQTDTYFDTIVDTAVDWYEPYAKNYILVSEGNHETSVTRRHEINLLKRIVDVLSYKSKSNVFHGLYSGFVVFRFRHSSGGKTRTVIMQYNHGYGGGGPVTKGVIQTNRKSVYLPDPDIVVGGHVHERWMVDLMRERLNSKFQPYLHNQRHVSLPCYKEEYLTHKGYHVENGRPPKPLGGCWLRFFVESGEVKYETVWAE